MRWPKWVKWLVCRKELQELERWQVSWEVHRRWLMAHRSVVLVLDSVNEHARGEHPKSLNEVTRLIEEEERHLIDRTTIWSTHDIRATAIPDRHTYLEVSRRC